MEERLLITVEHKELEGDSYEIYAKIPSRNRLKRKFGMSDYIPMSIVRLDVIKDK